MDYIFQNTVDLMRRAREAGLKYPRIRLQTDIGGSVFKIVLSLAGDRARFPGTVNVTSGHKYGDPKGLFYGRIHTDGRFQKGSSPMLPHVAELLMGFDMDPADIGRLQGATTGNCCFCGLELTTRESVGVGYGPICAERYGLPWGNCESYDQRKEELGEAVFDTTTWLVLVDGRLAELGTFRSIADAATHVAEMELADVSTIVIAPTVAVLERQRKLVLDMEEVRG